jgi:hypothetical protein
MRSNAPHVTGTLGRGAWGVLFPVPSIPIPSWRCFSKRASWLSIGMSSFTVMTGAASRVSALVHVPEEPYNLRATSFFRALSTCRAAVGCGIFAV